MASESRYVSNPINIGEAWSAPTTANIRPRQTFAVVSAGASINVSSEKVGSARPVDRAGALLAALAGADQGGRFGEHALHGPWLLRWGLGATVGAAFVLWLWDGLRRR